MQSTTEDPAFSSNPQALDATKKKKGKRLLPIDEVKKIVSYFNTFATKSTISAGCFNIALVANNVAQIKQICAPSGGRVAKWNAVNIVLLTFVCISLFLQFIVAIVLAFLAKQGDFIDDNKRNQLIRSNNGATILVLIITVINIFVNVFMTT